MITTRLAQTCAHTRLELASTLFLEYRALEDVMLLNEPVYGEYFILFGSILQPHDDIAVTAKMMSEKSNTLQSIRTLCSLFG